MQEKQSERCECPERNKHAIERAWICTVRKYYLTNGSKWMLTLDAHCETCNATWIMKGREQELYWERGDINPEKDFDRAGEIIDLRQDLY